MATLYYEAGFAANASALQMTCTVATHAVTVTAGTYAHQSLTTIMGTGNYAALAPVLQTLINTATGGSYTVTYSTSTHLYTISQASTFTLDFSGGSTDTRLANALGFTSTSHTGANSYTSDVRPYYVIVPTELARSASLPFVYEPNDIVVEAVSDGGTPYAVAKNTTELWADWLQTMEAKAACFDLYATASVPWTWQAFFKQVRGQHPFAVYESALYNAVYKLRADSAFFKPTPVTSDWDAIYNLKFTTRFLGALTTAIGTVSIAGTVEVGGTLTATPTGATPTPTYQWYRGATLGGGGSLAAIGGATSSTYTVVAADIDYDIVCKTTNSAGTATSNTLITPALETYLGTTCKVLVDDRGQSYTTTNLDTWANQGSLGSGGNFSATTTSRPQSGRTINGYAAPDFQGVSHCMTNSTTLSAVTQAGTRATVFCVVLADTIPAVANAYSGAAIGGTSNNYANYPILENISGGGNKGYAYGFDGADKSVGQTISTGSATFIQVRHDGSTLGVRVGSAAESTTAMGTITDVTGTIQLGHSGTPPAFLDGALAFFMWCDTDLSATQKNTVRAWCTNKYGVTT